MSRIVLPLLFALALSIHGQQLVAHSPVPSGDPHHIAETLIVPAGAHLLLRLTSPLHTTSARTGDGVYLEVVQPLVLENRVAIPAHTLVQGTVVKEQRPGRVKGRAQLRLHFNTLVLPDQTVVPIAGALQGLPGSPRNRVQDDEGTLEPVDQIDRDVYDIAKGVGAGAIPGALARNSTVALAGAGIGGGLALGHVLFSRGDNISLPAGTTIEMRLMREIVISSSE